MSEITATHGRTSSSPLAYVALGLAVAAAIVWVLAGIVDDGLYTVTGALGILAFSLGVKGRRQASRAHSRSWPAIAAIALGGPLGGAVIVASAVYGISHLVS